MVNILRASPTLGLVPMKVSSDSDPDMLHREADECLELLAQASFSGIIALLMEHADRCRIMADRIVAGQGQRPRPERDELVKAPELDHAQDGRRPGDRVYTFPWRPAAGSA
jgi:hypothetical protein